MPGNVWGLVAGVLLPRGPLSQQEKPFSHSVRAVTKKGEGCGERKDRKKERERQDEVSKEDLRVSCLKALFASFEHELACLVPSNFETV